MVPLDVALERRTMTSIPEISARGSLMLWAKFQIPVGPRPGREGENCRPLDHIRQIPFIHPAPFTFYPNIILYIYTKVFQLFLPYGIYIVFQYSLHLSYTHALPQVKNHFGTCWCVLLQNIGEGEEKMLVTWKKKKHVHLHTWNVLHLETCFVLAPYVGWFCEGKIQILMKGRGRGKKEATLFPFHPKLSPHDSHPMKTRCRPKIRTKATYVKHAKRRKA